MGLLNFLTNFFTKKEPKVDIIKCNFCENNRSIMEIEINDPDEADKLNRILFYAKDKEIDAPYSINGKSLLFRLYYEDKLVTTIRNNKIAIQDMNHKKLYHISPLAINQLTSTMKINIQRSSVSMNQYRKKILLEFIEAWKEGK